MYLLFIFRLITSHLPVTLHPWRFMAFDTDCSIVTLDRIKSNSMMNNENLNLFLESLELLVVPSAYR